MQCTAAAKVLLSNVNIVRERGPVGSAAATLDDNGEYCESLR